MEERRTLGTRLFVPGPKYRRTRRRPKGFSRDRAALTPSGSLRVCNSPIPLTGSVKHKDESNDSPGGPPSVRRYYRGVWAGKLRVGSRVQKVWLQCRFRSSGAGLESTTQGRVKTTTGNKEYSIIIEVK